MKGIVIYSSYFPNKDQLFRGVDFLNVVDNLFQNYSVYIGIQIGTISEWVDIIESYKEKKINIKYGFVDDYLHVNSDVSGYQKALNLLFEDIDKVNGEFIWFGHSKGVTTNNIFYHEYVLKNFWFEKETIEKKLLNDNSAGCYGNFLSFLPHYNLEKITDIWSKYSDFKQHKKPLPYMFTNTFFVVKLGLFMDMFLKIKSSFFNEKIDGVHGSGDRYFFERDFIHFVDMMGYKPLYNDLAPNISWTPNNNDYEKYLKEWT